jgi:hypothetical protein
MASFSLRSARGGYAVPCHVQRLPQRDSPSCSLFRHHPRLNLRFFFFQLPRHECSALWRRLDHSPVLSAWCAPAVPCHVLWQVPYQRQRQRQHQWLNCCSSNPQPCG